MLLKVAQHMAELFVELHPVLWVPQYLQKCIAIMSFHTFYNSCGISIQHNVKVLKGSWVLSEKKLFHTMKVWSNETRPFFLFKPQDLKRIEGQAWRAFWLSAGSWIGRSKCRDTCLSLCLAGAWIGALDGTYSWLDIRPSLRAAACWPSLSSLLHSITPHFCPTSTETLDKAHSVKESSRTKNGWTSKAKERLSLLSPCCHIKMIWY